MGQLIAQTVSAWDPEETSRRIELLVGRDLQFIRINGTLVGGLVGLFGPLGDLGVSMLKRQMGVKDSGALIAGHGGALDLVDSWLVAGTVGYYFVRLLASLAGQ